jgi:hypothetical protein
VSIRFAALEEAPHIAGELPQMRALFPQLAIEQGKMPQTQTQIANTPERGAVALRRLTLTDDNALHSLHPPLE